MNADSSKVAGLYIHIPFCLKKCSYCHFYSIPSVSLIPHFLKALSEEIARVRHLWGPFDTVYLGGGTPSVLTLGQLDTLVVEIRKRFGLLPDTEFTLEANPGDLTLSFLQGLLGIGINRLNLGIQSFDQRILDFLGRRHTASQAFSAIENARRAGFGNLGFDLMVGVPGQDLQMWRETLRQALLFSPEHLSCYQLTLEGRTPLQQRYRKGEFRMPEEGLGYDFFVKTSEWLEEAGYLHYEVSNFAKDLRAASRHNQKYWNHTPYLGLGPAAHSFKGNERWWNHPSLDHYLDDIRKGNLPIKNKETLTLEQLRFEAFFLGLRTRKGISLNDFSLNYHSDLLNEKKDAIRRLRKEGFLSIRGDFLVPTRSGLAIADSLALI